MHRPSLNFILRHGSSANLIRASAGLATLGLGSAAYYVSRRRPIHLDIDRERVKTTDVDVVRSSVIRSLSISGVHAKSRNEERLVEVDPTTGVSCYFMTALASNAVSEDCARIAMVPELNNHWSFFSVYDGHNGDKTSNWLSENLLLAIRGSLADLYSRVKSVSTDEEPTVDEIERTLKETFKSVDNVIVNEAAERALASSSRDEAVALLGTAYSGSCATMGFYNSQTRHLHVAATGDSRAILGRRITRSDGSEHQYEVYELTVDQNGLNPAEVSRLLSQHPGEPVVQKGRVLGWGVSRAFGNGTYKWHLDLQKRLVAKDLVYPPPAGVRTPPYLTAEPEVTTTKVEPGDFMIMASDGLWEWLTCEDAVGLVGWWLDRRASDPTAWTPASSPGMRSVLPKELPVRGDHDPDAVRVRTPRTEPRFVNTDASAATHLVRNALGGADEAFRAELLKKEAPESRRYRDDISVVVVFFT